jgi:hypothetical protein
MVGLTLILIVTVLYGAVISITALLAGLKNLRARRAKAGLARLDRESADVPGAHSVRS